MHQHPRSRSPPATVSPSPSSRANPTRTENSRDQVPGSSPQSPEVGSNNLRGPGVEAGAESFEQAEKNGEAPAKEAIAKLNQIISV